MKRRLFLQSAAAVGTMAAIGLPSRAMAGTAVKIGVPIPQSGPGGMFGTPCQNCATLAANAINARGGLLGRQIELTFIDTGVSPADAAQSALKAWKGGHAEAFVGFHDSATRSALKGVFNGQVPYVYTSLYEGKECSPDLVVVGETPAQQLAPVIPWIAKQRGLKKWYLIGNDYNWPRDTNVLATQYITATGGQVVGEEYVPFTVDNFDSSAGKIKASGADAVLITLVGGSSVNFNRAFAAFGLADTVTRLSPGIEELTLAGIGADNSKNLFASAGYFTGIDTAGAKAFDAEYAKSFGSLADLSFLSESVYEGMLALEAVAKKANSLDPAAFDAAVEGTTFTSPRGENTIHDRHATRDIYLAEAKGAAFNIVQTFSQVGAGDNCAA